MIPNNDAFDREIRDSIKRIERNYERLCIPKTDQSFAKVLAEFGIWLRSNPIFEPYIKNIADTENIYRQKPDIAPVLKNASFYPMGQQILDQEGLARNEEISEYMSLWRVLRFSELYDISLHERVRAELTAKNDPRDLADFEEGVIVISNILESNGNANLADYYLPHAHRVMCSIIEFFDKQRSISEQDQNILSHSKNDSVKYKREVVITFGDDAIELSSVDTRLPSIKKYDAKKMQDNLRFKLLTLLRNHHPKGLSKKQLIEECRKKYGQINRARRGINDQANEQLRCDDLIKRDRTTGRMILNDKYDIVFK